MNSILKGVYGTDSGMLVIWRRDSFREVVDYDSWERELLDDSDIERHIRAGAITPINIHSDGAFACEVRFSTDHVPASLSERERRFLAVSSPPYKFHSTGELLISGIEYVEKEPGRNVGILKLPPGDYVTEVHLIAWDEEPDMKQKDGKPSALAMPDFVVLLNPAHSSGDGFRNSVETFEKKA